MQKAQRKNHFGEEKKKSFFPFSKILCSKNSIVSNEISCHFSSSVNPMQLNLVLLLRHCCFEWDCFFFSSFSCKSFSHFRCAMGVKYYETTWYHKRISARLGAYTDTLEWIKMWEFFSKLHLSYSILINQYLLFFLRWLKRKEFRCSIHFAEIEHRPLPLSWLLC